MWQPRACARAHAGGFSHPAALNPDIKSFPTRGPSESEIQVLQKSSDMHASKMGAWPCSTTATAVKKALNFFPYVFEYILVGITGYSPGPTAQRYRILSWNAVRRRVQFMYTWQES
eukprot:COSAG05_NODE_2087_length_3589_cov_7.354728_2_plen_116_part_00